MLRFVKALGSVNWATCTKYSVDPLPFLLLRLMQRRLEGCSANRATRQASLEPSHLEATSEQSRAMDRSILLSDFSHSSAIPWMAARGSRTMCRNSKPNSGVDSLGATCSTTGYSVPRGEEGRVKCMTLHPLNFVEWQFLGEALRSNNVWDQELPKFSYWLARQHKIR